MGEIITPEKWGPHGWKFIHYVTLGYPDNPTPEQKENYKYFLTSLGKVLPCHICSNHFKDNLVEMPLDDKALSSKTNLVKWGIDIHNVVNKMKSKPELSYDVALSKISDDHKCTEQLVGDKIQLICKEKNSNTFWIMMSVLFGLIGIAIFYKKSR
jgi:hypothetical protein